MISGETEQSLEDQLKAKTIQSEIVSHWHPNLTINMGKHFFQIIMNFDIKT